MTPQLVIGTAPASKTVPLDRAGRFVIGRGSAADLALNDPAISRQHCALHISDSVVEIEDLGSSSGTLVNHRPIVGRLQLRHGDRIRLGDTILRFEAPELAGRHSMPQEPSPDATMVRRPGGAPPPEIELAPLETPTPQILLKAVMVLGRDPESDLPLPSREVSRQHAEIRRENDAYTVRDLSSTNGTYVNGVEVRGRMPLREGHKLRVGPYSFLVRGGSLWPSCQKGNARISLQGLTKTVTSRDTGQPLNLLDNVSLVIEPNEFVALLGPSGSGKSTLMDAMNGRRPASSGMVMVNDDNFYESYRYYRRAIGYVPQQDIVHTALTVEQAFTFTARLRLPSDTSEEEIQRIVGEVIEKMRLEERRRTLVANLSGGQLKRVSLGVELIADPSLLFLDEVTSGLDAGTEAKMMTLFRQVADEGKTVVCITHNVENVGLCDLVVVMDRGQLVYYGPPADLCGYFGVAKITEVYDRLGNRSAEDWERQYQQSSIHRRYVAERQRQTSTSDAGPVHQGQTAKTGDSFAEMLRQLWVLTRRYATVMVQDRKNVAILLAQAPIIAALLGLVFGGDRGAPALEAAPTQKLVVFLMAISAIWFGCFNAAKEIVKELPIYLRERAVNLHLAAYLGSKAAVLSMLCALQCLALFAIAAPWVGLEPDSGRLVLTLFLTSLCGMMMGLVVSALVDNSDKAMAIVPILLIPQVIFAGAIKELSGIAHSIGYWLIVSFWSFNAMTHTLSGRIVDLLGPKGDWGEDILALVVFLAVFAAASAWALKRKDSLD